MRVDLTDAYQGSCLCGTVKFEADAFSPQAANCHCSMCRKFHGAAFATIAGVPRPQFRWLSGEEALQSYTADNGTTRTFCRHCGSSLMFTSAGPQKDEVELALGAFVSDVPIVPNAHIFVGSAANWTGMADDLPRYSEGRDSERLPSQVTRG